MKIKDESHEFRPSDFTVLLGVHNHVIPKETGRINAQVNSIRVHPEWESGDKEHDADIAVLELASEVKFNRYIQPICMIDEQCEISQASQGVVVGFGTTKYKEISDVANKLDVPIHSYHDCIKKLQKSSCY